MKDHVVQIVSHISGRMNLHFLEEDEDDSDENRMAITNKW